jgi:hypothetical protein
VNRRRLRNWLPSIVACEMHGKFTVVLKEQILSSIVDAWKPVVDRLGIHCIRRSSIVFVHRRPSLGNTVVCLKEKSEKKMVVDSRLRESLAQQTAVVNRPSLERREAKEVKNRFTA